MVIVKDCWVGLPSPLGCALASLLSFSSLLENDKRLARVKI